MLDVVPIRLFSTTTNAIVLRQQYIDEEIVQCAEILKETDSVDSCKYGDYPNSVETLLDELDIARFRYGKKQFENGMNTSAFPMAQTKFFASHR